MFQVAFVPSVHFVLKAAAAVLYFILFSLFEPWILALVDLNSLFNVIFYSLCTNLLGLKALKAKVRNYSNK